MRAVRIGCAACVGFPWSYNRPPVPKSMNRPILRLLDANANRAREALRVLEDYARFVLNDDGICETLKVITSHERRLAAVSKLRRVRVESS